MVFPTHSQGFPKSFPDLTLAPMVFPIHSHVFPWSFPGFSQIIPKNVEELLGAFYSHPVRIEPKGYTLEIHQHFLNFFQRFPSKILPGLSWDFFSMSCGWFCPEEDPYWSCMQSTPKTGPTMTFLLFANPKCKPSDKDRRHDARIYLNHTGKKTRSPAPAVKAAIGRRVVATAKATRFQNNMPHQSFNPSFVVENDVVSRSPFPFLFCQGIVCMVVASTKKGESFGLFGGGSLYLLEIYHTLKTKTKLPHILQKHYIWFKRTWSFRKIMVVQPNIPKKEVVQSYR